ncbi:apolipoprotein B receptor [Thomomys bottae]
MDFLRQHLPGLHQALRGALDSLGTFVSYLIGDEVPTVKREAQAAQQLEEGATGKPEKALEEEAREVVEDLRGRQCEGIGGQGGSGRVGKCQVGSSAEQTWGWGAGTSHGCHAERQDSGTWETVKGQQPNDPLETQKEAEAEPTTQQDGSSGALENSKEASEQEVDRVETLSAWEQQEEEEEEEDGQVTEQGMARGVESQLTRQGKPERTVDTDEPKAAASIRETEQVDEEAATETKGLRVEETTGGEVEVKVGWGGESSRVLESTQGPGIESEDWLASGKEEVGLASGREETDFSEDKATEYGLLSGTRTAEATGRVWVLEEAPRRDQEEDVDERGDVERRLLLKQTQALGPEETEKAADGQTTERKKPEEARDGSFPCGKETERSLDLAIRLEEASLEEVVQVEETQRVEGHYQAPEAKLALDDEAEDKAEVEVISDAMTEEESIEERDEEAHRSPKALDVKVTDNQEPEPMGGTQTPAGQPEEAQRGAAELGRDLLPSEEWAERRLGPADPEQSEAGTWENERRKDTESRNGQEEKEVEEEEEEEEEAAASQSLEEKVEGKPLSELPEIQTHEVEESQVSDTENQVLEESQWPQAEPGQSLAELEARKIKAGEAEVTVPGEADCGGRRLEEAVLSLQDSQHLGTGSWGAELVEDEAGEGPEKEAGVFLEEAFEKGPESEGQEKVTEGENQDGQEIGTVGSAQQPTGQSSQAEVDESEEREQDEVGGSAVAEGTGEMDGTRSGAQAARAEGTEAMTQAEGLLEEARGRQVTERREGSKEQCGDHHSEGEAQKLLDAEDPVTLEVQASEPEALEDTQKQQGQPPPQVSAEAMSVSSETTEAPESTSGDPGNSWSEALLPGSLLDVSVPRSRVLLSRSSSQRRSRPSFRRSLVSEQQEAISSPQPQEKPSDPEHRPLPLPEEAPEPSPPKPEGTPVPTRRRPMGHGFGMAHPGMMQELQARLARPKPQ